MVRSRVDDAAADSGFPRAGAWIRNRAGDIKLPRDRGDKIIGVRRRIVSGMLEHAAGIGAQGIIPRPDRFDAVEDKFRRCAPQSGPSRRVGKNMSSHRRIDHQPGLNIKTGSLELEYISHWLRQALRRGYRRQTREEKEF